MFGSDLLSGLNLRLRSRDSARLRRRRADRRLQVAAEVLRLEERLMLTYTGVPIPTTNPVVPLSQIIWNGGPPLDTTTGISGVPSPSKAGAEKTITVTNNSPDMIYPFVWDANTGKDPNAKPIPPNTDLYYDPQDVHGPAPEGNDFRLYIGYQTDNGTKTFMGLPTGASITVQLPLVFWNGGNFLISSDPANMTAQDVPYSNIYHYNASAKISIAGTKASGTDPANTTTWVTKTSGYPVGDDPVVIFYFSPGKPPGVSLAAPAQLLEITFRDPYLKKFIDDNLQTYPLINYDVSYVDRLTTPVALEASDVPVVDGVQADPTKPIPKYYGLPENFGWNAANQKATDWYPLIEDFTANTKNTKAYIGSYFGGKGWPMYYNDKPNSTNIVIPAGASVFAQSPLTNAKSTFDDNYYLLTSSGNAPITAGGGGYGAQGFVHDDETDRIYLGSVNDQFVPDVEKMLKVGPVNVTFPGESNVLSTVKQYVPNGGSPYLLLNSSIAPTGPSGKVFAFSRTVSDYAVKDITELWYSWANYYVTKVFTDYPATETASLAYKPPTAEVPVYNAFTLTSTPDKPLRVGMTVTGQSWIRPGTTILNITNSQGVPIGSADAKGDIIYLSLIATSKVPVGDQLITFGKPTQIPYTDQVSTYDLTFPDGDETAKDFAASVYAAMSAEAPIVPDKPPLSKSAQLVSQVIQFNADLPTDTLPGGKNLTGQVRDVVKSLLRGVWNFIAIPDQNKWYPDPAEPKTGGKDFNVYNLDPYVWFVHDVENTAGYAFSVDDDVSNPSAGAPVLAQDGSYNHLPSNLQIAVGGIAGLINQNEWFSTLRWGELDTTGTISKVGGDGKYKDDYMITLTNPKNDPSKDPDRLVHQIFQPGGGEIGAYISSPGYIKSGTTLIFFAPNGRLTSWVMSQDPLKTGTDIPVVIYAGKLRT